MLTGLVLLFVGAVLFLNGTWMLGRVADREYTARFSVKDLYVRALV